MTAAVLLPGPSLAALAAPPAADIVIGVKRAAERFACDWAVALDVPDLRRLRFRGDPLLLTRDEYRGKYTTRPGLGLDAIAERCGVACGEWTSCAALALAGHLGTDRVLAYGADFDGGPEFGGYVPSEADYSPRRWERERAAWDALAAWLAGRGIVVQRLFP